MPLYVWSLIRESEFYFDLYCYRYRFASFLRGFETPSLNGRNSARIYTVVDSFHYLDVIRFTVDIDNRRQFYPALNFRLLGFLRVLWRGFSITRGATTPSSVTL